MERERETKKVSEGGRERDKESFRGRERENNKVSEGERERHRKFQRERERDKESFIGRTLHSSPTGCILQRGIQGS
jgi:hypothetical protein